MEPLARDIHELTAPFAYEQWNAEYGNVIR